MQALQNLFKLRIACLGMGIYEKFFLCYLFYLSAWRA
jgi:hypothetical protein